MPLRVLFHGSITVPQREFLDRVLREHFRHSVAVIEAEIERDPEADPGTGYRVTAAKRFVFADDYSVRHLAIKMPFLEADVSGDVLSVLEKHRDELARLDQAAGRCLLIPAKARTTDALEG